MWSSVAIPPEANTAISVVLTRSAFAVGLVNVALVVAWLAPYLAPFIAAIFIGTYLLSFVTGGIGWFRQADSSPSA